MRLKVKPYCLQLRQALTANDKALRFNFYMALQERIEEDDDFLDRVVFSDQATFHISGKVNKQNVNIWGATNPHCYVEHVRNSPKVNVFCVISNTKVYGPFFFHEQTVTGPTCLDMLAEWLLPQLSDDRDDCVLQQDGAPPHFHREVRVFLNQELPQRWMGCGTEGDLMLLPFPPRSPDLTPCDFFLWGYVKYQVFVPPLLVDIQEVKQHIQAAFESITAAMLTRVWEEMDYRVDVCRVTQGAHIKRL
ncbi:uncharacterized protein [Anabrus simplex]|uniref:uncharacterized protein n=1 Tax=Anabrus simplex TaxID=316456 RepID=UPI0035A2FA96